MVYYPHASLTSGKVQFADPAAFVNGLPAFRVQLRPTKQHWANNRPPVSCSIAQLERDLYITGNQDETKTLVQYYPSDKVKLTLDCDLYCASYQTAQEAFRLVETEAIVPILAWVQLKTGKLLTVDELVVEQACREGGTGDKKFKQSFHVYFPMLAITASRIEHLLDHLRIPAWCDRRPWHGELLAHVHNKVYHSTMHHGA